MSQYIFNPFIENLDKVSGVVTGIQFVGVIRNANLNPGYPSATPEVNQAWLVADNPGTVGGQPVSVGDIVLYTAGGWEIIPNGTVTVPLATEIVYGSVRIATLLDVENGSADDAAITPLKLFNYLQTTQFGDLLAPQLFARLLSDGSVTLTDNTTTIQLSLPLVGTAGTFGSASNTLTLTTDNRGRVTSVTSNPILITASQVSDLATYITNNFATLITSTTLDVTGSTINLPSVTTSGTYGNASNFPIITVDEFGRVTSITTTSITGNPNFIEDVQDIIGTSLNSTTLNISYDDPSGFTTINIPNTSVTPGSYGNQSQIATFTVNSQGRLTAASNVNINIATSQIADFVTGVRNILSTSLGNTSNVALTWNPGTNEILADLTNVGTLGTYGSGSTIPVITTDVKGRVTNVGLVNINWAAGTFTSSQVTDFNEAAQDAVGNAFASSSDIVFNYDDTLNQISAVLQPSGVTAGTYTKVSVDAKGRVTSATFLTSSDIPVHNHDGSHITTGIINVARLGVNPQPNTFLRGDGQFAVVTPTFGNQPPNTVFAGPATAPSNQPLFRALVNNDLPVSPVTPGTYGTTTLIPVVTVNDRGIVTGITTATLTAPDSIWGQISGNILNQTDLISLLGNYQLRSERGQPNGYASLDGAGRLPSSQLTIHTHGINDIVGLQTALDNKANLVHTHVSTDITDFQEAVEDVVGTSLTAGTGIGITYNDLTGEILIENTQPPVDPETIQDTVGQLFSTGVHQGISFTYDDVNNRMDTNITADLQKITDNGASTTNQIFVNGVGSYVSIAANTVNVDDFTKYSFITPGLYQSQLMSGNFDRISVEPNQITFESNFTNILTLNLSPLSGTHIQTFQNASGTIALTSNIPTSIASFSDFNESVDDRVASLLQAGTGISLVYNDASNTLTISTTGTANNILQNGNAFGTDVIIGSNDNFGLRFETNNTSRFNIQNDGRILIGSATVNNNTYFTIRALNTLSTEGAFAIQRSTDGNDLLVLRNDGLLQFGALSSGRGGIRALNGSAGSTSVEVIGPNNNESFRVTSGTWGLATSGDTFVVTSGNMARSSGEVNLVRFGNTINPSAGTAIDNILTINPTINQTGTATGEIRLINISPVVTNVLGRLTPIRINTGNTTNASHIVLQNSTTGEAITDGTRIELSGSNFVINNLESGTIDLRTGGSNRFTVGAAGIINVANLAGTGTRLVTASSTGDLSSVTYDSLTNSLTTTEVIVIRGTLVNGVFTYNNASITVNSIATATATNVGNLTGIALRVQASAGSVTVRSVDYTNSVMTLDTAEVNLIIYV